MELDTPREDSPQAAAHELSFPPPCMPGVELAFGEVWGGILETARIYMTRGDAARGLGTALRGEALKSIEDAK